VLKEIRTRGLHLVGAGAAEGAIDAASIPKPMGPGRAADDRRDHLMSTASTWRRTPLSAGSSHQVASRRSHTIEILGPARPVRGPPPVSITTARWWRPRSSRIKQTEAPVPAGQGDRLDRRGRVADADPPMTAPPTCVSTTEDRAGAADKESAIDSGFREGGSVAHTTKQPSHSGRQEKEEGLRYGRGRRGQRTHRGGPATAIGIRCSSYREESPRLRMEDSCTSAIGQNDAIKALAGVRRPGRAEGPQAARWVVHLTGPSGVGK
jgi:hypothetical protein